MFGAAFVHPLQKPANANKLNGVIMMGTLALNGLVNKASRHLDFGKHTR